MIVTCEECTTSFQLDESRIPATGARVRCSRCKHAFFLAKPETGGGDVAHSIAAQAAEDPNAGIPNPSSDLANPGPAPDGDEESWEFTEEIKVEADDDGDAAGDGEFGIDFGGGFDADALSADTAEDDFAAAGESSSALDVNAVAEDSTSSGLELDIQDEEISAPDGGIEAGHDDSSFGTVEDFSALDDAGDEDGEAAGVESIASTDANPLSDDDSVGTYSQSGSSEELENPESWDLAPDGDFSSSSLGDLTSSFRGGASETTETQADGEPAYYDDGFEETSALRSGLGHAAQALGWVVTATAIAIVAYLGFQSEWSRFSTADQSFIAGAFAAQTTRVGWLETARVGRVFVVDGNVRNTGAGVLRTPRLGVVVLDANGKEMGSTQYLVGDPVSEATLRESDPAALEMALGQARNGFQGAAVSPGSTRAFQAVILEMPIGASRVALDVVERVKPAAQAPVPMQPAVEATLPTEDLGEDLDEGESGTVELQSAPVEGTEVEIPEPAQGD